MEMFNLLTSEDKTMIADYIRSFSGDSFKPESQRASLDYILRFWSRNKSNLCELFGNKLILEKPIEVNQSVEYIAMDIEKNLHERYSDVGNFYTHFLSYAHDSVPYSVYFDIKDMFTPLDLAKNKYGGGTFTITNEDGKKLTVQRGCKTIKMLGKIANFIGFNASYGPELYENFRLAMSLATNQRSIQGTLCLSIHPLDYMTMSDNNSGWESCMSWINHGCYRRGTVEMMNSPYVVVAYLKSDSTLYISGNEWNSKKWRQLFIVDKDYISSIKGYPYANNDLSMAVLNWLKELFKTNLGIEFIDRNYIYDFGSYIKLNDENKYLSVDFDTNTMYNDFGTTEHHLAISKDFYNSSDELDIYCNYSGEEICMFCGEETDDFEDTDELICGSCDKYITCSECGDRIPYGEDYEVDGEYICEFCLNNETTRDPITDEIHLDRNMEEIFFISEKELDNKDTVDDLSSYPSIKVYGSIDLYDIGKYFNTDNDAFKNCFFPYLHKEVYSGWMITKYYVTPDLLKENAYELFDDNYADNSELIEDIKNIYENIHSRKILVF